jgi:DNA processing protein
MEREALAAWLRLLITPGIGPTHQRRLLATFGLPQQLFETPIPDLRAATSPALAQALRQPPPQLNALVDATQKWLAAGLTPQGPTRRLITLADPDYPPGLLDTEDPPLLLHAMGAALAGGPLAWPPMLAVVGSRNATPQGLAHARAFARHLVSAGWPVVSGLALGIDAAAHDGALEGAASRQQARRSGGTATGSALPHEAATLATVAVLGTGLDRIYPRQNEALAARIGQQGLLLSEFTLGTPPLRENFPRRNRLIAGLTRGTLVVEAAPQSGSLITARLAADMGREVFAIPGSIHSPQSRGCHALIRQGAKLVETAQDMLEELGDEASLGDAPDEARVPRHASKEDPVLLALGWVSASLDALQARSGLPVAQLQARLLELELAGQVGRLPGGLFQRIASA